MSHSKPTNIKRSIILYFVTANIAIALIGFGGAAYNFYWQIRDLTLNKLEWAVSARTEAVSEWLRLAVMTSSHSSRHVWAQKALAEYYDGRLSREELLERSALAIDGTIVQGGDLKGMVRLDRNGEIVIKRGAEIPGNFWPPLAIGQTDPMVNFFNLDGTAHFSWFPRPSPMMMGNIWAWTSPFWTQTRSAAFWPTAISASRPGPIWWPMKTAITC